MNSTISRKVLSLLALILVAPLATRAFPGFKKSKPDATANYLDDYLKTARAANPASPMTLGSLWVASGSLAAFATDYKAMHSGDLLTIHLSDNFTANTSGENNQSRVFGTSSAITGLVGTIGARNRLQNLFNANSNTALDGKGASTLSSTLTLDLAAQVIEVLPNGVLVVQATRDITVGNDRQKVILRGLVRPGDLGADNSILSSAISNLQVEIKGKGAVAEITRQPNIVVRMLLRILSF